MVIRLEVIAVPQTYGGQGAAPSIVFRCLASQSEQSRRFSSEALPELRPDWLASSKVNVAPGQEAEQLELKALDCLSAQGGEPRACGKEMG